MLTTEQISKKLYKHHLGTADTRNNRDFYEEAIKSSFDIRPDQLWMYGDQIPGAGGTAASEQDKAFIKGLKDGECMTWQKDESTIIEIVKCYKDLQLTKVDNGTDNSFKIVDAKGNQIKNIIPFNFSEGLYNYDLRTATGDKIYFGVGDWVVDTYSGVLTFYDEVPNGVSHDNPPTLSFYQYVGGNGFRQDTYGYDGAILPINDYKIEKGSYIIPASYIENDSTISLEEKIIAMADKIQPGFAKTYGFDGADTNEGVALSLQKIISLMYTKTKDEVKGHDDADACSIGTLLTKSGTDSEFESFNISFISNNFNYGTTYALNVEDNVVTIDDGPSITLGEEGTYKIFLDDENFIIIDTKTVVPNGTYTFTVEEVSTYGVLLYLDKKGDYIPYRTNEEANYDFGFPIVAIDGKIPPSVTLGSIALGSYNDSITPDYYGPRAYSVVIAVEDGNVENSSSDIKSSDYVVRNRIGFYLEDIFKQIEVDFAKKGYELKGTIFLRAGNYHLSSSLDLANFNNVVIVGEGTGVSKITPIGISAIKSTNDNDGALTLKSIDMSALNIEFTSDTQNLFISDCLVQDAIVIKNTNILFVRNSSFRDVNVNAAEEITSITQESSINVFTDNTFGKLSASTGATKINNCTISDLTLYDVVGDDIKNSFINYVINKPEQTQFRACTVLSFSSNTPFNEVPRQAHFPIYKSDSDQYLKYASFSHPFEFRTSDDGNTSTIELLIDDNFFFIMDDGTGRLSVKINSGQVTIDVDALKRDNDYTGASPAEAIPNKTLQEALVDIYATKADLNPNGKVPLEQLPDSVAYGGLLYVGNWSFEIFDEDGKYVSDGKAYPTIDDINIDFTYDKTHDEGNPDEGDKLQPGWFFIVESSEKSLDNPVAEQTAAKQEGEDTPLVYTAGDWLIWNGTKWEKLDKSFQDPVYSILPTYTTGERLYWNWKQFREDGYNAWGNGALKLGGETIAEAFDMVNQELFKLRVQHSPVLRALSLTPIKDYKEIVYHKVVNGSPVEAATTAYDATKDSTVPYFRMQTPTTLPKYKSLVYVGDQALISGMLNDISESLEVDTTVSEQVDGKVLTILAAEDPYADTEIGRGYWKGVGMNIGARVEDDETHLFAGEHFFKIAVSETTPDNIDGVKSQVEAKINIIEPMVFPRDSEAYIAPNSVTINSDTIIAAEYAGICSGIETVNEKIRLSLNFVVRNAIDYVNTSMRTIELYDKTNDKTIDIPAGKIKYTGNAPYTLSVSGLIFDYTADSVHSAVEFAVRIYDVYNNMHEIYLTRLNFRYSEITEIERVQSGSGIAPTFNSSLGEGCGAPYNSSVELMEAYKTELQKVGRDTEDGPVNEYVWPHGVYFKYSSSTSTDYNSNNNSGDALDDETYSGTYRYVTLHKFFDEEVFLDEASGFTIEFDVNDDKLDAWKIDPYSYKTDNLILQAKLVDVNRDTDQGLTEWFDCNSPYDGFAKVGTQDGQPAMYAGSSSATKKRITFGKDVYSGKLILRVGFKYESGLSFKNVTIKDII